MFTICSLYVHYIFTICSLYVQYIFTICLLYIHYMFTIYSLYVYYIFTICLLDIHCKFIRYSPFILPQGNLSCSDWLMAIGYIPTWPCSLTSYLAWNCLSIEYILIQQPAMGYRTYPTPRFHISHPSFASWDIITSVWDKSPNPMAGCWINYNVHYPPVNEVVKIRV